MKPYLMKELVRVMRATADKIDAGNCELTEEEAMEIMAVISHEVIGKGEACAFVGLKASQFDYYIRIGLIPKGRKYAGFNELRWRKDELRECLSKIKH